MKWSVAAAFVIAVTAAFVAGRWSMGGGSAAAGGGERTDGPPERGRVAARMEAAGDRQEPVRARRERPAGNGTEEREKRLSAPWEEMAAMVQLSYLSGRLDHLARGDMEKALELLGANEADRKDAVKVMVQAEKDLREAEKRLVTVKEAGRDTITLDRSGMADLSKEVTERAKRGLRDALPEKISQVVVDGVNWNQIYMNPARPEVTLRLEARGDGRLQHRTADGYWEDVGMVPENVRRNADGSYAAEDIFRGSWKEQLKGLVLVPGE